MKTSKKTSEIANIFVKLGASKNQASIMASQLCKRATQVAKNENRSDLEVLSELLEIAVLGAQGMTKSAEKDTFEEKNTPNR